MNAKDIKKISYFQFLRVVVVVVAVLANGVRLIHIFFSSGESGNIREYECVVWISFL